MYINLDIFLYSNIITDNTTKINSFFAQTLHSVFVQFAQKQLLVFYTVIGFCLF